MELLIGLITSIAALFVATTPLLAELRKWRTLDSKREPKAPPPTSQE